MSLSRLLSGLFTGSEPNTESPATTQHSGESDPSPTVIYECRTCGTTVSADTACCPACDDDDIVRYSID
ncbi:hypothetical protein [Haloterrigena salinisoli]|uniref:hypothetical protein n=1 Tax=Haloterrigena salinisoli TaxID=3132747 RepID=UPI0030D5AAB1